MIALLRIAAYFIVGWFVGMAAAALFFLSATTIAHAQPTTVPIINPLIEIRHCGMPLRDVNNKIIRSRAVTAAFQRAHPCPANGSRDVNTKCPHWEMDHVWPLADGGCDAVWNLQWLPDEIKRSRFPGDLHCKDCFERKINGDPMQLVP